MDKIQKALIKAGRKDLAQEYYLKVAEVKTPNLDLKYGKMAVEGVLKRKLDWIRIKKFHSRPVIGFAAECEIKLNITNKIEKELRDIDKSLEIATPGGKKIIIFVEV